jgi:PAS domain S-box-containing protein
MKFFRVPRKLAILAALLIGLHLLEIFTLGTAKAGPFLAEGLEAVAAGLAAAMCFRACRRARGMSRPFWLLLGLGIASQCFTDLIYGYYEIHFGAMPNTNVVLPVLVLTRAMFFAMALFLDPQKDSSRLDVELLVDFAQVMIVFFFMYLYLFYIPAHNPLQDYGRYGLWSTIAMRGGLILLAIVQRARTGTQHLRALQAGFLIYLGWYFLVETSALYLMFTYSIRSGTLLDMAWVLPTLAVALWAGSWEPGGEPKPVEIIERRKISDLILANATFALAPLIVLLQVTQLGSQLSLLRYSLLGVSILCFASRLGISELRQSHYTQTLWKQKRAIETGREELAMQKAFLEQVIESAPEAIAIVGTDRIVQQINREFTRLYGYYPEEACGRRVAELIVPTAQLDEHERFYQQLRDGGTCSVETTRRTKEGAVIDVSFLVAPVDLGAGKRVFYCSYRDISERKRTETQLRQAQKMEAIGRLAGGVAHDFNNILSAILGYSDLSLDVVAPESPVNRYLAEIKKASNRAALLTRQLLAFSRQQVVFPKVLNLNEVVRNVTDMLLRMVGEDIAISFRPTVPIGSIHADLGQIEQVLVNLVVNARDAMPSGGKIVIETGHAELDEDYVSHHPGSHAGQHVVLTVSDTGCGMDENIKSQIFEPFFTTKGAGQGTGLGLSTAYGIVKQSGGNIFVYSEPGKGTTFKIYFPTVAEKAETLVPSHQETELLGGSETILVVEDEESVRELAVTLLQGAGYRVIEAKDAETALYIMKASESGIDLLLTDVIMPGKNGGQLLEQAKAIHPNLRSLFISGYAGDLAALRGGLMPEAAFLAKPFTKSLLLTKVYSVLHS